MIVKKFKTSKFYEVSRIVSQGASTKKTNVTTNATNSMRKQNSESTNKDSNDSQDRPRVPSSTKNRGAS